MNEFPDYVLASNAAYATLLKLEIRTLPIDIKCIIKMIKNIRMMSYGDWCNKYGISRAEFFSMDISYYGFTIKTQDKAIILYNEYLDECSIRFTLAHELGHIVLKHTEDNDKAKKEANCYARNILCPIPVIAEWRITDPRDYVDLFNVSPPMAMASTSMRDLDMYNISNLAYYKIIELFSIRDFTKEQQKDMIIQLRQKRLSELFSGVI